MKSIPTDSYRQVTAGSTLRGPPEEIGGASVMCKKRRGALLAHVAREHARLRRPEIDDYEPVQGIAELVVSAEPQQPPSELEVLLEEDRYALVVVLDPRDDA